MTDTKILDAVRQLDVENDNHWTADGLPRLETVRMMASDPALSRDDVEAGAPGFNRKTAREKLQGDGAAGNGAGVEGAEDIALNASGESAPPVPPIPTDGTPPTAPSNDALLGTDNDTLREQASEPGPGNLNADGNASNGPSVSDEAQAAAAAGSAQAGLPPEITQGATMQGTNTLATPESDLRDAVASTSHGENTPPELGGPPSREGAAPGGQTVDEPTVQDAAVPPGEAELSSVENGTAGDPDALEALEAELEEASEYSAQLKEAYDKVGVELQKSTANESRLRNLIDAARPRSGTMAAIQSYFDSQDAAVTDVLQARTALLESGVDLAALAKLVGPAAIDKATADANKKAAAEVTE